MVYGWAREYFGLTANPQAPAEEAKGICVSLKISCKGRGHESEKDKGNAVCPVSRRKQGALEGNGKGACGGWGTSACG